MKEKDVSPATKPATRYPLPATRYPLPATRYPLPATRDPRPATRKFIRDHFKKALVWRVTEQRCPVLPALIPQEKLFIPREHFIPYKKIL